MCQGGSRLSERSPAHQRQEVAQVVPPGTSGLAWLSITPCAAPQPPPQKNPCHVLCMLSSSNPS